ncbi:adenylyl-sulfate kinase [Paraburkholderia kururiensis]|uniref:Adenylyl-sulfate kinase n=1 Tax=Paraburkholderia kururiensis TaxID=984307 RepID=A0ABZ0WRT7_9BURK|nr:adenylyl-sulfate kinase [Paraburkholderia kururiensis]WQD79956.1 adenylyl-sulfate kinase [Paraburkholderia kururiensis]
MQTTDWNERDTSGGVLWLTGLPGAGKSTLAQGLHRELRKQGVRSVVLDGDHLRSGLNRDLGFSCRDRFENVRRVAEVATLLADAGLIAIVALVSPLAAMRAQARQIVGQRFRELYVSAPLDVCEARDPKGLYGKARAGELPEFTGVSAPYETPVEAELTLDTANMDVATCVSNLLHYALGEFAGGAAATHVDMTRRLVLASR